MPRRRTKKSKSRTRTIANRSGYHLGLTPATGASLTPVKKYLERYAESGTAAVADMPGGESWRQVLVVPVCNESSNILRPLPRSPGRALMILVVNETESAQSAISRANRVFVDQVGARFEPSSGE